MSWELLFERAPDMTVDEIRTTLADHRAAGRSKRDDEQSTPPEPPEPTPTRVVADADVLAADCCLDGPARAVLDDIYTHSWISLVASDPLIDDAEAVIRHVADRSLASEWREQIDEWRQPVDQPAGDQPAVASAYRGGAMHVLSFDEQLTASGAGTALNNRFPISIRTPDAFELLFDPESLYESEHTGAYPGPDRERRV